MIDAKMQKAINKQINAEIYSAYLYLSMSAYFEAESLTGFAQWMRVQYEEELAHALRFYQHMVDRGGRIKLLPIEAPPTDWQSPIDIFEETLKHERHVTSLIHKLVDLSVELKDHATNQMLQWFVAEQVEEEATAETILDELKLIGDAKSGLFLMNRELAQRQAAAPAPAGE